MKHLLCEHQNTISELKADGLVSSEMVQEEHQQLESKLHNEMRSIMVDMQELDNEGLVKELELVCSTHQIYFIPTLNIYGFNVSLDFVKQYFEK